MVTSHFQSLMNVAKESPMNPVAESTYPMQQQIIAEEIDDRSSEVAETSMGYHRWDKTLTDNGQIIMNGLKR